MQCTVDLDAAHAFALVADFATHERWIPLTTISVPSRPLVEGDEIVARSAGFFVDRMEIVELTPPTGNVPGVMRVRKVGPVLLGDAVITVLPIGPDSSVVRWDEDVWLAGPLPISLTRAVLTSALSAMLAFAARGIRRDAAALGRVRERRRAA
jgi:hypothetical protein